MADLKLGEPFGIDAVQLKKIDWSLAINRILHDVRTDFIYAPHLNFVYKRASKELIEQVVALLKSGSFSVGLPITIEVPKSYRIRVLVSSKRLGPAFSRPGSILLPYDRLLYQALADKVAPLIDGKVDYTRSFSHKLAPKHSSSMFLPTRTCWSNLQKSLKASAKNSTYKYILKIDVANYFGSLNQHTLINVLNDAGYIKALSSRLEVALTSYTVDRSSRGILQGMYPSDLLGNFYLSPLDRFLSDMNLPSARYVDDLYVFIESVEAAEKLMRDIIPFLRSYDLTLNETKCVIMPKAALQTEEPDLEELFDEAVDEISSQVDDEDFQADYGFQAEWDEDANEGEDALELKATKVLFAAAEDYIGHEENIERFCLPLFAKAQSDFAVDHVIDAFKKRPSMAQIYAAYLAKFLSKSIVSKFLNKSLSDSTLTDWQRMWIFAAILQAPPYTETPVKDAINILKDGNTHEALRAVAAIYAGRYGDLARRKQLSQLYSKQTDYVKSAIYYSSRYWKGVEKSTAKASWGSHNQLNKLMSFALSKG